jgi:diketogulonate reductase-like aldo/keto reductase
MLSWLTSQPQIVTVVKALSPIHIEENIRATSLDLLPDEISLLKESFPGRILRPEKTFLI